MSCQPPFYLQLLQAGNVISGSRLKFHLNQIIHSLKGDLNFSSLLFQTLWKHCFFLLNSWVLSEGEKRGMPISPHAFHCSAQKRTPFNSNAGDGQHCRPGEQGGTWTVLRLGRTVGTDQAAIICVLFPPSHMPGGTFVWHSRSPVFLQNHTPKYC